MKNVILWGDSIRIGYGPFVAAELGDLAGVRWPEGNCENSTRFLANWQNWLGDSRPDVLHLNCGLHDVRTISARRRDLIVPLKFYQRNLEILLEELRLVLPDARLIFATTTPILQPNTASEDHVFQRYNSDIEAFNEAAREIAAQQNIAINDLWQVVQTHGPKIMINADGVHYDEAGNRILGEAVARAIIAELK